MLPLLLVNHALASFLLGDWQRAHADLNSADQIAQEMGVNALSASLPVTRGRLYLAEGRPNDAARVIAEGLAFGEPDAQTFCDAQSALAERELLSGRPAEVRGRLAPLVDKASLDEPDIVALLPLLAWATLEMDETEHAANMTTQAIQLMQAMGMRVALPNALRIQAMVAQRLGNRVMAETAVAEAVTLADAISYPYAKAQALLPWALLAPEDAASQERLREARSIFTRLGASGDVARAERALKARGNTRNTVQNSRPEPRQMRRSRPTTTMRLFRGCLTGPLL